MNAINELCNGIVPQQLNAYIKSKNNILPWQHPDGTMKRKHDYRFERELGSGGFGTVFLATEKRFTKKEVAIKVLDKPCMRKNGRKNRLEKIMLEAQIMNQQGHHPNIVPLLGSISEPSEIHFVMPKAHCSLADLHKKTDILRRQPDFEAGYLEGILLGVQHLHENGIAHLDLKPENILIFTDALDRNNNLLPGRRMDASCVKVADFGVSKISANYGKPFATEKDLVVEMESHRLSGGTYMYMAPEILRGACADGRVADMWSVGILLGRISGCVVVRVKSSECHRLCKEVKFRKTKYLQVIDELQQGLIDEVELLDKSPLVQVLHSLLMGFLALDASTRVTAAHALQHPFFSLEFPPAVPVPIEEDWEV